MQTTKEKTMKTKHVSRRLRRFGRANEAVSALEYAILVGVIAVAIGAALFTFGESIEAGIKAVGDKVKAPTGVSAPDLDG